VTALPPIASLPSMPFGPIGATPPAAPAQDVTQAAAAQGSGGFAGMLSDAVSGLNSQLTGSEQLYERAATGQLADPTSALVAVEKADLAFNTAVQVRNKLVEGWQELSRMQV
jgi:flagellar hook-basal body complex protein FliE